MAAPQLPLCPNFLANEGFCPTLPECESNGNHPAVCKSDLKCTIPGCRFLHRNRICAFYDTCNELECGLRHSKKRRRPYLKDRVQDNNNKAVCLQAHSDASSLTSSNTEASTSSHHSHTHNPSSSSKPAGGRGKGISPLTDSSTDADSQSVGRHSGSRHSLIKCEHAEDEEGEPSRPQKSRRNQIEHSFSTSSLTHSERSRGSYHSKSNIDGERLKRDRSGRNKRQTDQSLSSSNQSDFPANSNHPSDQFFQKGHNNEYYTQEVEDDTHSIATNDDDGSENQSTSSAYSERPSGRTGRRGRHGLPRVSPSSSGEHHDNPQQPNSSNRRSVVSSSVPADHPFPHLANNINQSLFFLKKESLKAKQQLVQFQDSQSHLDLSTISSQKQKEMDKVFKDSLKLTKLQERVMQTCFERTLESAKRIMAQENNAINEVAQQPDPMRYDLRELHSRIFRDTFRCYNPLPSLPKRLEFEKLVRENQFVIVRGSTGSGKSTQLSQYLADMDDFNGLKIICTQPRKLAATSLAARVAYEYAAGSKDRAAVGGLVGYHVGGSMKLRPYSKIIYTTEGALLAKIVQFAEFEREEGADLDLETEEKSDVNVYQKQLSQRRRRRKPKNPLQDVGAIILDEAHERSVNLDVLLGILKDFATSKYPHLKLIVASASLDAMHFSRYLGNCPKLEILGHLFPVDVIYKPQGDESSKSVISNVVREAIEITKGQEPGDILCFLSDQEEAEKSLLAFEYAVSNDRYLKSLNPCVFKLTGKQLETEQQKVFEKREEGRKIIFATDVAETSLTIDGVCFIIDSGYIKDDYYDAQKNTMSVRFSSISKSSADQRKGRAGRTSPGTCIRLYSESHYESMNDVNVPEVFRRPVATAMAALLGMNLNPFNFPWIDRPKFDSLKSAFSSLLMYGSISSNSTIDMLAGSATATETIKNCYRLLTPIGKLVSTLHLEPGVAKMLYYACSIGCGRAATVLYGIMHVSSMIFSRGFAADLKIQQQVAEEHASLKLQLDGDMCTYYRIFESWLKLKTGGARRRRRMSQPEASTNEEEEDDDDDDDLVDEDSLSNDVKSVSGSIDEEAIMKRFQSASNWCREHYISNSSLGLALTLSLELRRSMKKTVVWHSLKNLYPENPLLRFQTIQPNDELVQKLVLCSQLSNIAIQGKTGKTTYHALQLAPSVNNSHSNNSGDGNEDFAVAEIHPYSALISDQGLSIFPKWICYQHLIYTNRSHFNCVTPILSLEWFKEIGCPDWIHTRLEQAESSMLLCSYTFASVSSSILMAIFGKGAYKLESVSKEIGSKSINIDLSLEKLTLWAPSPTLDQCRQKMQSKIDSASHWMKSQTLEEVFIGNTRILFGSGMKVLSVMTNTSDFVNIAIKNLPLHFNESEILDLINEVAWANQMSFSSALRLNGVDPNDIFSSDERTYGSNGNRPNNISKLIFQITTSSTREEVSAHIVFKSPFIAHLLLQGLQGFKIDDNRLVVAKSGGIRLNHVAQTLTGTIVLSFATSPSKLRATLVFSSAQRANKVIQSKIFQNAFPRGRLPTDTGADPTKHLLKSPQLYDEAEKSKAPFYVDVKLSSAREDEFSIQELIHNKQLPKPISIVVKRQRPGVERIEAPSSSMTSSSAIGPYADSFAASSIVSLTSPGDITSSSSFGARVTSEEIFDITEHIPADPNCIARVSFSDQVRQRSGLRYFFNSPENAKEAWLEMKKSKFTKDWLQQPVRIQLEFTSKFSIHPNIWRLRRRPIMDSLKSQQKLHPNLKFKCSDDPEFDPLVDGIEAYDDADGISKDIKQSQSLRSEAVDNVNNREGRNRSRHKENAKDTTSNVSDPPNKLSSKPLHIYLTCPDLRWLEATVSQLSSILKASVFNHPKKTFLFCHYGQQLMTKKLPHADRNKIHIEWITHTIMIFHDTKDELQSIINQLNQIVEELIPLRVDVIFRLPARTIAKLQAGSSNTMELISKCLQQYELERTTPPSSNSNFNEETSSQTSSNLLNGLKLAKLDKNAFIITATPEVIDVLKVIWAPLQNSKYKNRRIGGNPSKSSNAELPSSSEDSPQQNSADNECPICFCDDTPLVSLQNCQHKVCRDCMTQHLSQFDLKIPVECPMTPCSEMTLNDISNLSLLPVLERIKTSSVYFHLNNHQASLTICPKPGCGQILSIPKTSSSAAAGGLVANCFICNLSYCLDCSRNENACILAHRGYTCEMRDQNVQLDAIQPYRLKVLDQLNLKCPACSTVFFDFVGCCALRCNPPCNRAFCAFCQHDCGQDAHPHVRSCQVNPKKGNYFVSVQTWEDTQRPRRKERCIAALKAILDPVIRLKVLESIKKDLEMVQITITDSDVGLPSG